MGRLGANLSGFAYSMRNTHLSTPCDISSLANILHFTFFIHLKSLTKKRRPSRSGAITSLRFGQITGIHTADAGQRVNW